MAIPSVTVVGLRIYAPFPVSSNKDLKYGGFDVARTTSPFLIARRSGKRIRGTSGDGAKAAEDGYAQAVLVTVISRSRQVVAAEPELRDVLQIGQGSGSDGCDRDGSACGWHRAQPGTT